MNSKKATPYNTILAERAALGDTRRGIICPKADDTLNLLSLIHSTRDKTVFGDKHAAREIFASVSTDALQSFDLTYPLDTPAPEEIYLPTRERFLWWAFEMRSSRICGIKGDLADCIAELLESGDYVE